MNLAEKILVVCDQSNYNLCSGGKGGFGYLNSNKEKQKLNIKKAVQSLRNKYGNDIFIKNGKKLIEYCKINKKGAVFDPKLIGKFGRQTPEYLRSIHHLTQTIEANEKRKKSFEIIQHQQGSKNSQFGSCWITNGQENKKIKKENIDIWIEKGYKKGRIIPS
jgi:hypothetical protein